MPDRFLQDVITNLTFQSAWIEIGQHFLRSFPQGEGAPFVRRMLETKSEMVNMLSRALRQSDYAPTRVQPDAKLTEQGKKRRTPETALRYIHHGLLMSQKWYQDRLHNRNHPFQELWQALYRLETALKQEIERTLNI